MTPVFPPSPHVVIDTHPSARPAGDGGARRAIPSAPEAFEAFAGTLAHDLRSPLRVIEGYARALVEDHGPALPDDARDLLARIVEQAGVLDGRVDALLRLSAVAREPVRLVRCDLAAIVAPLVDQLRRSEPARRVIVTVAPAMLAMGDPSLLGIVLENLLANAWKFTRGRQDARIDVRWSADADHVVVSLRDNGAGFDMNAAHRLGVPFQRLHSADDYEGTGIGLASSRRIIERHGGRLWAESAPGQGATFFFTLPAVRTR